MPNPNLKAHHPLGSAANPEREKSQYMFLFRHGMWDKDMTPEQITQVMDDVTAWFDDLAGKGKILGGSPLEEGGKTVQVRNGNVSVMDGPFVESKEAVAGYILVNADSIEEAVEIAKTSPLMKYDTSMCTEVREVAQECPMYKRYREKEAAALA